MMVRCDERNCQDLLRRSATKSRLLRVSKRETSSSQNAAQVTRSTGCLLLSFLHSFSASSLISLRLFLSHSPPVVFLLPLPSSLFPSFLCFSSISVSPHSLFSSLSFSAYSSSSLFSPHTPSFLVAYFFLLSFPVHISPPPPCCFSHFSCLLPSLALFSPLLPPPCPSSLPLPIPLNHFLPPSPHLLCPPFISSSLFHSFLSSSPLFSPRPPPLLNLSFTAVVQGLGAPGMSPLTSPGIPHIPTPGLA